MKFSHRPLTDLVNLLLLVPALFLVSAGLAYLISRIEAINDLLGLIMATTPGRLLLSPVAVLGGPLLVLVLNVPQLCRLEIRPEGGCLRFSLLLQKATLRLIAVAIASLLITLLLAYAFAENFKVLPR